MTQIPYLDLKAQYNAIRGEVLAALEAVCESTRFAQGPPTLEFEKEFAAYCGAKHCVTLNNGTSALHLAMRCLDIGPGDEVITVPFTFIATAWAISYVGAKPVFVDVDPERRTLDPKKLEAVITPRTKAVVPVHLFGMSADMDAISAVAAKHGIPVVEDAAQAHGARYQGKRVGKFGCMACFSFYPGKNLGAYGEGGALTTDNDAFAARARALREHGSRRRYYHDEVGYNYRMDSFQAAVLSIKLRRLDEWNAARREKARRYAELLAGSRVKTPATFADSECVWHCYVVEVENRDAVRQKLAESGIETGVHYPVPLHLQKAYASLGHQRGDFPVSERIAERCLSLPIYPELTDEQQQFVAKKILRS
ncbi:MAG: DegT/DnrJ/EryC1/StrS family aminotransferase [Verrucomicrobia bacterium]|nr:DegT/DnrJ/EryC1/StrS family aminotransferase [Verrucomicrobiota bacterium]